MEGNTKRNRMALRLLFASAIIVAAVAIVLTWHQPAQERAEAAGGGPEMALSVKSGSTTCPTGTSPGTTCVTAGAKFILAAEAIGIPANGYVLAQSFIDYGGDLIYNKGDASTFLTELIWPDCSLGTAQRSNLTSTGVAHGCITGQGTVLDPLVPSTYIGNLYEISLTCSAASSSTFVELVPNGISPAGTSGALYTEFDTNIQFIPKINNLTIDCLGPTPTPSDTPIPPTPTPTVSPTPTDTPTPLPPPSERPDVKVTKIDLVDPVDSGGSISYQITVESIGLQTAEDVVVVDTLPAGSVFKSATSAGATCSHTAGVVTCNVTSNMPPTDLITIDIVVNAPAGTDTLVDNTVTVTSSNEPFANTGNNKDIEQTMVLAPRSDVTLEKVGDPTFLDGGGVVTYTLIAKNLGPHPAQNVQIVDTLPGNASFVSATNPQCGAPAGGKITCDLGTLAPGAESIVEIVLTVPDVTRSIFIKNSAFVSADNELYLQTGNNFAVENTPVVAPPPDLVVTKTDSQDPILRLGFYSYEITVLNQGLGDALDVVITDTLPVAKVHRASTFFNYATFLSATGGGDCQEVVDHVVECTFDEINAGQQVVITLFVRAPTLLEDQSIINSVTAVSSDPDENPAGNDASESTLLRACFDVDGDTIVDLPNDITLMILHMLIEEGDPDYDVIYDFDGDGFIGLANDLLSVMLNFGQDCSLLL